MPSARAWLEPRLASAPEELADAIRACLERAEAEAGASGATGEPIPDLLARAALLELDRATEEAQSRAAALRLLAADALLTYAFESAAELGHDLRSLADRLGPGGALGDRLAASLRDGRAP